MLPFKVTRCRYFELNGNAIPPYCSLGCHCTFLHPDDEGWPGRDPCPPEHDGGDKSPSQSTNSLRHRSTNSRVTDKSFGQSKYISSSSRLAAVTDVLSNASSTYYAKRDGPQSSRKSSPPIPAVLKVFHDIARTQIKLTQGKEQLKKTSEKLAAYKELYESLNKISTLCAAAVNLTLDTITQTQQEIKAKYEDNTRCLSELWADVMHIFLRTIYHQFDIELESGTDFLRQETHILVRSLRKQAESYRGITTKAKASGASTVNPVGQSDNGWECKRRRISTLNDDEIDYTSKSMNPDVTKLLQRLDAQDNKINALIFKNEALEKILEEHQIKMDIDSKYASENNTHDGDTFDDERFSQYMRPTLHSRIMDIIAPALEHHKVEMKQLGARVQSLADEFRCLRGDKHETMPENVRSPSKSLPDYYSNDPYYVH